MIFFTGNYLFITFCCLNLFLHINIDVKICRYIIMSFKSYDGRLIFILCKQSATLFFQSFKFLLILVPDILPSPKLLQVSDIWPRFSHLNCCNNFLTWLPDSGLAHLLFTLRVWLNMNNLKSVLPTHTKSICTLNFTRWLQKNSKVDIYLSKTSTYILLSSTNSPILGIVDCLIFGNLVNVKWCLFMILT